MPMPVTQNPSVLARALVCARETAVDSSIVKCAAAARRQNPGPMTGDIRIPYAMLRTPSRAADAIADGAAARPPAPTMPTNANCEPPVNIRRLRTHVCQTSSPEATARAPKETP
jgi:hypothetical protein